MAMSIAAQHADVVTATPSGGPLVMRLASSTSFASSEAFGVWRRFSGQGNGRSVSCGRRRNQTLHPV